MNFNSIIRVANRVGGTIKKHSPQIMMAIGAITSVTAVVEAVKQTPKAMDILDEHKGKVEKCKEALALNDADYTEDDYKKDLAGIYFNTGTKLGKAYIMPIVMETASLICFFSAHRIMCVRNKQLATTLAAATEAYNSYRNRMIEALGEEKEEQIRLGLEKEKRQIEVTDENGKVKKVNKEINVFDEEIGVLLPWQFLWCEDDINYDQSEELNDFTISCVASTFTNMIFGKNRRVDEMPAVRIVSKFIGEKKANKLRSFLYNGYTQANLDQQVIIDSQLVEVRYRDEDGNVRYKNGRILTLNGDGDWK